VFHVCMKGSSTPPHLIVCVCVCVYVCVCLPQAPGSTNPTAQAQQAHDRAIVVKEDDGEVLQMYLDDSATDYGGRPDEEAPPG
jgi:hypothetical protein